MFIGLFINGIFYGHYRTKISKKYNIHSLINIVIFVLEFNSCVHQLALCQEYNTVYRLEESIIYPVNTM